MEHEPSNGIDGPEHESIELSATTVEEISGVTSSGVSLPVLEKPVEPAAVVEPMPDEEEGYWDWLDDPAPAGLRYVREVTVRLDEQKQTVRADALDVPAAPGCKVLVEGEDCPCWGQVTSPIRACMSSRSLPCLVRQEGRGDKRRNELQRSREEEAFRFCQEKIRERKLPMKLVRVQYQSNGNKAVFSFGAEGRIDFRQLVRDLAQRFHTRIEMKQIGVRDEAKTLGGIGTCGLPLCCRSFLEGFAPVSIRMAKTQNLSLNPQKVSGQCGRLLCCLNYEQKTYEELRKGLPKLGGTVETPRGPGRVRDVDVLRRRVQVQLENGPAVTFVAGQVDEDDAPSGGAEQEGAQHRRPLAPLVELRERRGASSKERAVDLTGDLPQLGQLEEAELGARESGPATSRERLRRGNGGCDGTPDQERARENASRVAAVMGRGAGRGRGAPRRGSEPTMAAASDGDAAVERGASAVAEASVDGRAVAAGPGEARSGRPRRRGRGGARRSNTLSGEQQPGARQEGQAAAARGELAAPGSSLASGEQRAGGERRGAAPEGGPAPAGREEGARSAGMQNAARSSGRRHRRGGGRRGGGEQKGAEGGARGGGPVPAGPGGSGGRSPGGGDGGGASSG